jgi:catechol 2,3-dioxygenase-like lactoylglutathione lyase family enzyme
MLGSATLLANLKASDMDESIDFYGQKLGLELVWEGEILPGAREALLQASGGGIVCLDQGHAEPSEQSPISFAVDDVDETVATLKGDGIKFEEYDLPSIKTENGIATIGSVKAAWFRDPAGNMIAITSNVASLRALDASAGRTG